MRFPRSFTCCGLILAAAVAGPVCAQGLTQPGAGQGAQPDMAMPDDLGAPLDGPATTESATPIHRLSVSLPIAVIASTPRGREVLDRDLPGLCQRPEFMMFKSMSPAKLATLSRGRITQADIDKLDSDLSQVSADGVAPHQHSIFTRGGRTVGRVSKALYHRVALMIASL